MPTLRPEVRIYGLVLVSNFHCFRSYRRLPDDRDRQYYRYYNPLDGLRYLSLF
jgi:hypothetical protein